MTKIFYFVLGLAVISVVVVADKNVKLRPLRRLFKRHAQSHSDESPDRDSLSLEEPLQDQPRQRSSYTTQAEYEEELRRRQEMRKRYEEERQKLMEERRRQENERRRQQEDRKRQENERRRQEEERLRQGGQERQESERRRQEEERLRQSEQERQESERRRQEEERLRQSGQERQESERRRPKEDDRLRQSEQERQQNERHRQEEVERLRQTEAERRHQQQSFTATRQGSRQIGTSRQPVDISRSYQLPDQTHHVHQDLPSYDTFNQDTRTSHQQGQRQAPPTQHQSGFNGSLSHTYQPFRHSGYSSGSRIPHQQQSVHRTNQTSDHSSRVVSPTSQLHYHHGQRVIPNQRQIGTQQYASTPLLRPGSGHSQGPYSGRVDPRLVAGSPGGLGQNYWSGYEYAGQGNWYPAQDTGSSYNPFNEPEVYSACPDTGVELRINGLDCQQAVEQWGSSICYSQEYASRLCCEVCRPRKQPTRTGCEYGDHSHQCSTITPADCYDVRNRQICCDTCHKLRKIDAAIGCEYGDMSIRCDAVRQNPGLCYRPENQRICCESCSQSRNVSNPGCPWGDFGQNLCQMFDDHTHNVRVNCYSHQKRRLCCQTCERLKEWLPHNLPNDCQYGDRPVIFSTSHYGRLNCSTILNYFSVDECSTNPTVYVNCCYTCHRHLQGRGRLATNS